MSYFGSAKEDRSNQFSLKNKHQNFKGAFDPIYSTPKKVKPNEIHLSDHSVTLDLVLTQGR